MKSNIDLNIEKKFEENPLSKKFVMWAVSWGRAIVLLTQILVLAVFGYRFLLDQRLSQLTNSINQKQTELENSAQFETGFRQIQNKLLGLKEIINNPDQVSPDIINKTIDLTPPSTHLSLMVANPGVINLSGNTTSPIDLAQLIRSLKQAPDYKRIVLTSNAFFKEEGLYRFSLSLET